MNESDGAASGFSDLPVLSGHNGPSTLPPGATRPTGMDRQGGVDRPGGAARPSGTDILRRVSEVCWRLLLVAVTLAAGVWVLRQVWPIVVAVVAAGMAATALSPLVGRLHRARLPRLAATWLVFLLAVATLGGLATASTASLGGQVRGLGPELDRSVEEVKDWATGPPLRLEPNAFDNAVDSVREQFDRLTSQRQLLSAARMAVTLLTGILLGLVLLFFFLKDGSAMAEWSVGLFPANRQTTVKRVARRARKALEGYLRGTALIGLVEGIFIGVLLAALGVPQFLPLAALTFMAAFFPIIGAISSGLVAVLVTLVETNPTRTIIAAVAILVMQQIDGDLLQPLVMSSAVRLHPVVVLLTLTAGGLVAGITGAFLAVPLTAVVAAATNELRKIRQESALTLPEGVVRPP